MVSLWSGRQERCSVQSLSCAVWREVLAGAAEKCQKLPSVWRDTEIYPWLILSQILDTVLTCSPRRPDSYGKRGSSVFTVFKKGKLVKKHERCDWKQSVVGVKLWVICHLHKIIFVCCTVVLLTISDACNLRGMHKDLFSGCGKNRVRLKSSTNQPTSFIVCLPLHPNIVP